ncbi:B12-binding domain-containing radical SAM protein [Dehalobacterium formicoaceticum]|uniref:Radical SAM protein n=1 Tax=Dehalobacterium formicoaceticum TaxID=51515 RepID=A0ABT1Y2V5_9FIRM|nr:radical SAM protein [Dehalobacterium formicoaceticum]MCR6544816.1 radical SAM protein [Dehalobacterium formicoaceticum]
MKILFVRPKPHPNTIGLQSIMICEPLELEYLAAAIQDQHQAVLVDLILEKKPLTHFIKLHRPQVVALTAYIAHVNVVKDYARIIKKIDPQIKVVLGGVHADVVPEDFLDPHIDIIFSGNGIKNFAALMDLWEKDPLGSLKEKIIKGLGVPEIPSLFPLRSLTVKYRSRYYYLYHKPCALLKTSYGCPYSCSFCFCRQITEGQYRERDLDQVIEELSEISEPEIYIVDDNFLVDPQRVDRFCTLLKAHGIKKGFLIYGRADFIAQHEEIIAKFAAQGLRAVIVGVESPNPRELEEYHKNSSVEINEKAIKILRKYGIDCYATMILGLDWDDRDFDHLSRWLREQKLRFVNLQPLTPLPGTPLFAKYQDSLAVPREKYEEWDLANLVVQPTRLSLSRYYYQILKVYFRISLTPENIKGNLKYGFSLNLRIALGVLRIIRQYLKKILGSKKP